MSRLTLDDHFIDIGDWQQSTFNHKGPKPVLYHMIEEIQDELLGGDPCDIDEWADLFILWAGGVRNAGHSLQSISHRIDAKMTVNRARTWNEPDHNGVVRHVKLEELNAARTS